MPARGRTARHSLPSPSPSVLARLRTHSFEPERVTARVRKRKSGNLQPVMSGFEDGCSSRSRAASVRSRPDRCSLRDGKDFQTCGCHRHPERGLKDPSFEVAHTLQGRASPPIEHPSHHAATSGGQTGRWRCARRRLSGAAVRRRTPSEASGCSHPGRLPRNTELDFGVDTGTAGSFVPFPVLSRVPAPLASAVSDVASGCGNSSGLAPSFSWWQQWRVRRRRCFNTSRWHRFRLGSGSRSS